MPLRVPIKDLFGNKWLDLFYFIDGKIFEYNTMVFLSGVTNLSKINTMIYSTNPNNNLVVKVIEYNQCVTHNEVKADTC